jgi:uncharacterized membrane protein (UPF0136 family)
VPIFGKTRKAYQSSFIFLWLYRYFAVFRKTEMSPMSLMNTALFATLAYGILALAGGIFGYVKVKSKPSLISGTVSGILLLAAAIMQAMQVSGGLVFAIAVTAALVVVFTIRLVKTRKFMPAGLMLIAGIVTLVVMGTQFPTTG